MFEEQLARIPPEPPRPLSLLPGLRLRSVIPLSSLWFAAFFLLFFATVPLILALQARLALGRSETVPGTVLEVTGREEQQSRTITYAFRTPTAVEFRGSETVRRASPYAKVGPGASIPIRFLTSNPSINGIDGEGDSELLFVPFFVFPLFGLFIFGPFVLPALRAALRDRRLFRTGRVTVGTVVFVKPAISLSWPGWPGRSSADVFVTFRAPGGGTIETKVPCANQWLLQHLAPGVEVHLAYLPRTPARAMLLDAYVR